MLFLFNNSSEFETSNHNNLINGKTCDLWRKRHKLKWTKHTTNTIKRTLSPVMGESGNEDSEITYTNSVTPSLYNLAFNSHAYKEYLNLKLWWWWWWWWRHWWRWWFSFINFTLASYFLRIELTYLNSLQKPPRSRTRNICQSQPAAQSHNQSMWKENIILGCGKINFVVSGDQRDSFN